MPTTTEHPKIKLKINTITPSLARRHLSTCKKNRRINKARVERLAVAMANGEWIISQPLMFDTDGKMIDGQHRMSAIIGVSRNCAARRRGVRGSSSQATILVVRRLVIVLRRPGRPRNTFGVTSNAKPVRLR